MIGRAASTNPWIFRQISEYAEMGTYFLPAESDRYRLMSGYFRNLISAELPDAIGRMKQFGSSFTHTVRNGSELRRQIHLAHTAHEVMNRVEEFFAPIATAEEAR
jgi:tRNA-dihydrouridine synthase